MGVLSQVAKILAGDTGSEAGDRRGRLVAAAIAVVLVAVPQGAGQQLARTPAPRLPDLRVVDLTVDQQPLPNRAAAVIEALIHNQGPVAASGDIVVRLAHDGLAPQPLPTTRQIVYLPADGLETVSFELTGLRLSEAPYELSGMVDAAGVVAELDETNNVKRTRVDVCQAAEQTEVEDGIDNNCDGRIDEGFVGSTDPAQRPAAVLMALRGRIPMVFALARPLGPFALTHRVSFRAADGSLLTAVGGGGAAVLADRTELGVWERFTLFDLDGGTLEPGDPISLRTADDRHWVIAAGGGGSTISAQPDALERALLFAIAAVENGSEPGRTIRNGDQVTLQTSTGHYVVALGGGGGEVRADRIEPGPWERFTIHFEEGQ